jgi:hypothetical protein
MSIILIDYIFIINPGNSGKPGCVKILAGVAHLVYPKSGSVPHLSNFHVYYFTRLKERLKKT